MSKRSNKKSGVAALAAGLLTLAAACAVFVAAGAATRYVPLYLLAYFCLMPAVINAALLALGAGAGDGRDDSAATGDKHASDKSGEHAPDTDAAGSEVSAEGRVPARALHRALGALRSVAGFFSSARAVFAAITVFGGVAGFQLLFFPAMARTTSLATLSYPLTALLLCVFLVLLVVEKWCAHSTGADGAARRIRALLLNIRSAMLVCRVGVTLTAAAVLLRLAASYDAQRPLTYILAALWIYCVVFTVCSAFVRAVKRELVTNPRLRIPIPFLHEADGEAKLMTYLEESTGLTLRSLWSIGFIRSMLPVAVVIAAAVFWLGTGVVQIGSYQQGAVYRLGVLREETLLPGLHLTYPWPVDSVEIYDTESIGKLTIGYSSADAGDNVWTNAHSSEYKLLLGGGNELVSINLRLGYRISDLNDYLRTGASPEKMLEAKAYELVTKKTINTDLTTLLSADRSAFAGSFRTELEAYLAQSRIGLEIVSVVLESIHPPVEVADIYQQIVSAGIRSEQILLAAGGRAAVTVAQAQQQRDVALSAALAEKHTKTAQASSSVSEFTAGVEAFGAAPDAYRYYRYLNAVRSVYGSARLIIIGEGIDSSRLYIGSAPLPQSTGE